MSQIVVLGLGYVGINLFNALQKKYSNVIGIDINKKKIELLNLGIDPSNEIKNFKLLNKSKCLESFNYLNPKIKTKFFICVPTPVKKNKPDLTNFKKCLKSIALFKMKAKFTVINESSVYPGQTEDIAESIFKRFHLKRNHDYFLCFSPERINPGDKKHSFNNINKIVASDNIKTLNDVSSVYKKILSSKIVKSLSIFEAEASKLIENAQRDVNIAFMNQMDDIFCNSKGKLSNILNLAKTKWNFCDFKPGYVGGHCIAVDPYYLIEYAKINKKPYQLLKNSRLINDSKIINLAKKINKYSQSIKKNKLSVLILGITYKPNVPDLRESQAMKLIKILKRNKNINLNIYDPLIEKIEGLDFIDSNNKKSFDIVVYMSMHDLIKKNLKLIQKFYSKNALIL